MLFLEFKSALFGFCPFPLLSEYIYYNRKVNITLNFMFHIYDKKCYKRDVTCYWTPPLCYKLSHLLGTPSRPSVMYFMDGPLGVLSATQNLRHCKPYASITRLYIKFIIILELPFSPFQFQVAPTV